MRFQRYAFLLIILLLLSLSGAAQADGGPENYSAYFINDYGAFVNIIDSEIPMISGTELDGVSDWVEERISKVNEFIYG